MKRCRDAVSHLQDVFERVGDAKVPDPDEIPHESCAIIDGRAFLWVSAGIRDVPIWVASVGGRESSGGIHAEAWFWIHPSICNAENAEEKTWKEPPEESGE